MMDFIYVLSTAFLGVFLGAQIAEAILLMPYWKMLSPDDFFQLHKTYGPKIHRFFAPLTIAATVIPIVCACHSVIYYPEEQIIATIMGTSTLLFFLTYFLYFKKANQQFADRSLLNEELHPELRKWGNWHWSRIALELIAFSASLYLLKMI